MLNKWWITGPFFGHKAFSKPWSFKCNLCALPHHRRVRYHILVSAAKQLHTFISTVIIRHIKGPVIFSPYCCTCSVFNLRIKNEIAIFSLGDLSLQSDYDWRTEIRSYLNLVRCLAYTAMASRLLLAMTHLSTSRYIQTVSHRFFSLIWPDQWPTRQK